MQNQKKYLFIKTKQTKRQLLFCHINKNRFFQNNNNNTENKLMKVVIHIVNDRARKKLSLTHNY